MQFLCIYVMNSSSCQLEISKANFRLVKSFIRNKMGLKKSILWPKDTLKAAKLCHRDRRIFAALKTFICLVLLNGKQEKMYA